MNMKLLITIGAVVLLLGGGGAYYFLVMAKETPPLEEEYEEGEEYDEGEESDEEYEEDEAENISGPLMEPFTVNLADVGGRRYLRCTVRLKLFDQDALDHLETHIPELRDAAIVHLSGKRIEDTLGAEAKIALREELLAQLNTVLEFEGGRGITKLFFTEFLVQ